MICLPIIPFHHQATLFIDKKIANKHTHAHINCLIVSLSTTANQLTPVFSSAQHKFDHNIFEFVCVNYTTSRRLPY